MRFNLVVVIFLFFFLIKFIICFPLRFHLGRIFSIFSMHTYFIPECIHLACEQYKFFKIVITSDGKRRHKKSYFKERKKNCCHSSRSIFVAASFHSFCAEHPDAEATTNSSYWSCNLFEIKNECNEY